MKHAHDGAFEIQPVSASTLPEVAGFLERCNGEDLGAQLGRRPYGAEPVSAIERRLKWLLVENPFVDGQSSFGYCVRDGEGVIRGLNLCFPIDYSGGEQQFRGLCSGTFLVEPVARSLGFYLFKKCLSLRPCSFYFASTCNTNSSQLWKAVGGAAVPNSEVEYFLPLTLDVVLAAYVAYRTSSRVAAKIARFCGRSANPLLRMLTRPSTKLMTEPSQDWEKLATLAHQHRPDGVIAPARSLTLLAWRYGPGSPSYPATIHVFRDKLGNEGWFALGHLLRGEGDEFRASVLLDAVWPQGKISYGDVFQEILRVTASQSDAISFRWHPGQEYGDLSPCVIRRKFSAPRAFVSMPRGTQPFPVERLDYDDSDFIAWMFPWKEA